MGMATGWTEGRAVWNKGWAGVLDQTRDVGDALPFRLLGFDFSARGGSACGTETTEASG